MIYRDHRFHYRPTSPGSVLGNITLGFYIPPPHKHTHAHLISSKRGKPAKMFFIRWPPSIVPFLENTPNSFWRNSNEFHSGLRSHGTVYCGGEKSQIDQHWFSLFGGNQRPITIHCLWVGGWGQKVQVNLKPESKLQEALVDQIALCVYCDFPQKYFMETVLLVMHISEFEYKHNLLNTRLTQN